MINQKTVELIGTVINSLLEFIYQDEAISSDFNSYLGVIGMHNSPQSQKVLLPYLFERRLGEERRSVFELYLEKNTPSKEEKAVIEALRQNISSVFRVENLMKIGFELFNIINEKSYPTYSMVKMTNLRGVGVGQYIIARVLPYNGEYYLLELNEVISQTQEEKAFRIAVAKQIQDPSMLYQDNPEKREKITAEIKKTGELFEKFFDAKKIFTLNKKADELLGLFNEYVDGAKKPAKAAIKELIKETETLSYFEVSSSMDFVETAAEGFGSSSRPYDIGLVYDDNLGLFVIPFLKTFEQIFEGENYSSIEGAKACVKHFLESDKIPPFVLKEAYDKDSKKFLQIINDATEGNFKSFKTLEKKYKFEYLEGAKFSSTTVLYLSEAFNKLMGFANEEKPKVPAGVEVGRNEPCPCGSGKKYKKCCLR